MIDLILTLFISAAAAQQSSNVYIKQIGNSNAIYVEQESSNKTSNIITNGDLNYIDVSQKGLGSHTSIINQPGPGGHSANISQSGNLSKNFTLTLLGTGIGVSIMQNNLLSSDVGSMSIQCLTPPCFGYSYTKN